MESDLKWVVLGLFVLVSGCAATVGVLYLGEKKIAQQGMEQKNITYCSSYSTKTIWVKSK